MMNEAVNGSTRPKPSFPVELTTIDRDEVHQLSGVFHETTGEELTNWQVLVAIAKEVYGSQIDLVLGASYKVNDSITGMPNGLALCPVLVTKNNISSVQ